MDEDSPHRIGQPLVPDISWDAQLTLRVHGAKLECRGSWWRLVTQICILLVLRVHLANLPTAMLPLLDLFHQKRFTWKMGSMKKTWKRQKKHIVYGNKITKAPSPPKACPSRKWRCIGRCCCSASRWSRPHSTLTAALSSCPQAPHYKGKK